MQKIRSHERDVGIQGCRINGGRINEGRLYILVLVMILMRQLFNYCILDSKHFVLWKLAGELLQSIIVLQNTQLEGNVSAQFMISKCPSLTTSLCSECAQAVN